MLRDSPLIQELLAEQVREDLAAFLEGRFGAIPADLIAALRAIAEVERLTALIRLAAQSPDLDAFRSRLPT